MSKPYTKLWSSLRVKWLGQQAVWLVKGSYSRYMDSHDKWVVFAAPGEAAAELYAETLRRDLSKARNELITYYLPLKKLNEEVESDYSRWENDQYRAKHETARTLWYRVVDAYVFLDNAMSCQINPRRELFTERYDDGIAYTVEMVMMMPDISDPYILERSLGEV